MNTTPFTTACCGAFFEFSRLARQRIARHAHGSCLLPEPSGGRPCLVQWHIQFLGHHTYFLLLTTYLLYRSFPALPGGSGGGAASPLRVLVVKIVQLSNSPIPQFGVTFSFLFISRSGIWRSQNPEPIIAQ